MNQLLRYPDGVSDRFAGFSFYLRFKMKFSTAIEYGLIAAGISVAIIAIVNGLGCRLNNTCDKPPAAIFQSK